MPTTKIDLTPELENRIVELYKETNNVTKMERILNIERHFLGRILKKYNLIRPKLSEEKELEIINVYLKEGHAETTRFKFGISAKKIWKILRKYEIDTSNSRTKTRYKLKDINFLKNIDADWKSYYLGLFYADGCLHKNVAKIELSEDGDILKALDKEIFVNSKLRNYMRGGKMLYDLSIANQFVADDMRSFGLHERKSLDITFPKEMENSKYIGSFIRGYFDGDGSISKRKNSDWCAISICVSIPFGEKLKEILSKHNINSHLYFMHKDKKMYNLVINNQYSIMKFYNLIYHNNPEIYLDRKRQKFENLAIKFKQRQEKKRYEGIYFRKRTNDWGAIIGYKKKTIHIGYFKEKEEARIAREKYIDSYLKERTI